MYAQILDEIGREMLVFETNYFNFYEVSLVPRSPMYHGPQK